MNLVALMPVRNEDWILGLSLRAALLFCDEAVVLNHASTDRTADILAEIQAEYGNRVTVLHEPNPAWDEMHHRQRMLETARKQCATHIALVDADEVLTGNMVGVIRQYAETMKPGFIWELPGYNLRGGLHQYHATGTWANRWFASIFVDEPRLGWTGDRFHHREPMASPPLRSVRLIPHEMGGLMHLWGASERRLKAKHLAYQLTERIRWPQKNVDEIRQLYSLAIYGSMRDPAATWKFARVPAEWWEAYGDLMQHLHLDAAPWQESFCREVVASQPGVVAGVDTFGVV